MVALIKGRGEGGGEGEELLTVRLERRPYKQLGFAWANPNFESLYETPEKRLCGFWGATSRESNTHRIYSVLTEGCGGSSLPQ